jgi:hypothetical protein
MAGHQPESGFSAERSQLYESALWLNPGKAIDSTGVQLISFVVLQIIICIRQRNNIHTMDILQVI